MCIYIYKILPFFQYPSGILTGEFLSQILIAMDRADEITGKMEELHNNLKTAYSQIPICSQESSKAGCSPPCSDQELPASEVLKAENLEAEVIKAFQRSNSHDLEVKSCPSGSPSRYSPGFPEIYKRT